MTLQKAHKAAFSPQYPALCISSTWMFPGSSLWSFLSTLNTEGAGGGELVRVQFINGWRAEASLVLGVKGAVL